MGIFFNIYFCGFQFIPPYSPHIFPLSDEAYSKMLLIMPDNHPLSTAESETHHQRSSVVCNNGSDSESNSGHTYNSIRDSSVVEVGENLILEQPSDSDGDSCSVPPEEDPNDPEWNASAHTD